jgi:superoxide dismutase, Cu-Zn family
MKTSTFAKRARRSPWGVAGLVILGLGCAASPRQAKTLPEPSTAADPTTVEVSGPYVPGTYTSSPSSAAEPAMAPALPPAPEVAPGMRAAAQVAAVNDSSGTTLGLVTFEQIGARVSVTGQFTGLTPGLHGFSVHDVGDCGGKLAANAGRHFNPSNVRHGPIGASVRHVGDFGNLDVDEDGHATFEMTTDSLTVSPGPDSVVGRALVIHARKDNGKTQPSGSAGPAVACGVINT